MTRSSDDLDALTGDLRNLSTLVGTITNLAIETIDPDNSLDEYKAEMTKISNLLWIARDMVETISGNAEAAHRRVIQERKAVKG